MKMGKLAFSILLSFAVILPTVTTETKVSADVIKEIDGFEDGTIQGWGPRIGSENVTLAGTVGARSGIDGMLVAGRTKTFQGASKDVTNVFELGKDYTIRAWVKLTAEQWVIQRRNLLLCRNSSE
ncbi:Carbohydrate binding domain protein [compost metagenome]